MKVLTRIDPFSGARVASLLGVLWALLGWFMNSLVIAFLLQGSGEGMGDLPSPFSIGGLLSGIVGGLIGGAISGYCGALVYNLLGKRGLGVRVEMGEVPLAPPPPLT